MARKFEFQNNALELNIAGNMFQLDTTDLEVVERIENFGKEATKISGEVKDKKNNREAVEMTTQFCLDAIDSILGEGASKKIFAGRKVSLFDCIDVMNFIMKEVKADRENKFKVYSPNRAQRRAKK